MCGSIIKRPVNPRTISNNGEVFTILYCPALADLQCIIILGYRTADTAVEGLVFKIKDRVGIIDGGSEESFCVEGVGGINDFQPRHVYKPCFVALGMKGSGADPGACGHPDHDVRRLTPAIVDLCEVVDYLVKTRGHKIRE